MIGFFVGAISGAVQYFLLSRFTGAIIGGKINAKIIAVGIGFFFLPLAVLLVIAFLLPDNLVWAGGGMAASLVFGAFFRFIRQHRNSRGTGK